MYRVIRSAAVVGAWLLLAAPPAAAQNTNDMNAFDFSLPGARSRAMGGAFVAIADDATSVYSNPAGLNQLFRPEVSIEGRQWRLSSTIPNRGHAFGPPTGIGTDTLAGVQERRWTSETTGLSFLSFVYPARRWAVGVFRHQLTRFEMTRQPEGPYFDCRGGFRGPGASPPFCEGHALDDGIDRIFPKIQSLDLDIHSTGSAVAFNWTDHLSVGVALQYFTFDIALLNQVFSVRQEKKYGAPDFSPENLELTGVETGRDHAWAMNLGALWELSDQWVAGASFRQGPKFTFLAETTTGPANLAGGGITFASVPDNPFRVPDTWAFGLLFRPSIGWRLSVEYDRVNFGQLIDDFREVATGPGDPEGQLFVEQVRLDDANQFRGGAEYAHIFGNGSVLAVRGGVWHDPQHQTYFDVEDAATGFPAARWALLFPKQTGSVHWSAGLGVVIGRHLQIDAAADFSDPVDILALSSVWRF